MLSLICFLPILVLTIAGQENIANVEPGPGDSRFETDAFIRIESLNDGRRRLVVAEEERLLHILMDEDDTMLECSALRRKHHLLDQITEEIVQFEESGVFPEDVEFIEMKTDVGWYGRKCRKTMRDQLRAAEFGYSELKDDLLKEVTDRNWVDKRIEGTNFCSRRLPRHSYIPAHLGEKLQLDQCCMSLWSCEDPIEPLWYKHSILNTSHFPLFSCSCFKQFLACLGDLEEDEEASRLRSAWGQYGGECYNLQAKTSCEVFDTWFGKCERENTTMVAKIEKIDL